jgi:hypothetical protein
MILRSVLQYLHGSGCIPQGSGGALPRIASYSQVRLPKNLSNEQISASLGEKSDATLATGLCCFYFCDLDSAGSR